VSSIGSQPLVSCVMPTTSDRRRFVQQSIKYFQRQTYANKELLIVDDGSEPMASVAPDDPQVRYIHLPGSRTLGAKRNLCVKAARGDLIMHWDDDDWMAPHRIHYQVESLLRKGAEVCGLRQMLFYNPAISETWLYSYPDDQRLWLAGGSLLYTREFWRRSPFPDIQVASDTRFICDQQIQHPVILSDYSFYVAMIHPGNTSPKNCSGDYWKPWTGDIQAIMEGDLSFYRSLFQGESSTQVPARNSVTAGSIMPERLDPGRSQPANAAGAKVSPAYTIIMVAHNALRMTRLATLRTLAHSRGEDARLVVVDSGSSDGTEQWLRLLAVRGDIDLIRSEANLSHGPGLELARKETQSPYIITLDSDAFPLADDWISQLRSRLNERVKVTGIRHHRDYIHPSCLMIARDTLDNFDLSFLNEKDRPSQFDVAERITCDLKQHGFQIAGLERSASQRRGSISEPVYLGAEYEGLVYHQWYTTRAATSADGVVDDVPPGDIQRSLDELFARFDAEPRDITVVMGIRVSPDEPERLRNAQTCLQALNLQNFPRWRYRLVVVEQDVTPRLENILTPLVDKYVFAFNPGPYNRGWAFNIGACLPGSRNGLLCFMDADLLVAPDFLRRGLETVQAGLSAVLPYREILYLDPASTERAVGDYLAAPVRGLDATNYHGRPFDTSQGGCIWVEASLYHKIGGHDERFRGWGREDREFCDRLERVTAMARLPGTLLHLYHTRPEEEGQWATTNQRLYDQIALSSAEPASSAIGCLDLYSAETGAPVRTEPDATARDWENWYRWDSARIEGIVRDEQRRPATLTHRQPLAKIISQLGESILDVGCGPGALWPHLEACQPGLSWMGVDVTEQMLAAARRLFPHVPTVRADGGCLPFQNEMFDVVLMRHLLEHVPQWLMEQMLLEAMRVAKRAVVVDFYLGPAGDQSRRTCRTGDNFLETCWTVSDVESFVTAANWSVEARFSIKNRTDETDTIWILTSAEAAKVEPSNGSSGEEPFKISIIMPTYQRWHTILRTIRMIQAQTYHNWELIVIDNEGQGDYHFNDPRIHVYRHAARASASYARNEGLRHVTGDLICFFDDDDDMFPNYLESFARTFQAYPKAKMVRCGMIVSDGGTNFSYATPECCLRKEFATPDWSDDAPAHDQRYFSRIVDVNQWSETDDDIVVVRAGLCRANSDPLGGLRSGRL
jgi:glycosyltransferase involved in cell wall biosynthesis